MADVAAQGAILFHRLDRLSERVDVRRQTGANFSRTQRRRLVSRQQLARHDLPQQFVNAPEFSAASNVKLIAAS